mgnify:FL=1
MYTLKFTIHFATINTAEEETANEFLRAFTIHFATINTNQFIVKKVEG